MDTKPQASENIREHIHKKLQEKLDRYAPITTLDNHIALSKMLPANVRRQYSAVHSLATSIGMSFYEQIAVFAAKTNSDVAMGQWHANTLVAPARQTKIEEIVRNVGNGSRTPDLESEVAEILAVPNTNTQEAAANSTVDVYIKRGKDEYYIDIKTVAPNKPGFLDHKRTLLMWVARADSWIHPCLALPYNPYHPEPYQRVGSNVMQVGVDLRVGKDFWDFVGWDGFYEDLVYMFQNEGDWYWQELKKKMDGDEGEGESTKLIS